MPFAARWQKLQHDELNVLYSIFIVPVARRCYGSSNGLGGHSMLTLLRRGLEPVLLAAFLLFSTPNSQAQDKKVSSGTLKLGFLMDSLKVERWQTDLDKFQKRAAALLRAPGPRFGCQFLYWGRRLGSGHDAGNFPLSAGPKRKLRLDRGFSVG